MVKINVIAVGKIKESYYQAGVDEYVKRLSKYAKVRIVEVKEKNLSNEPNSAEILETLKREGEEIKKELKGACVALAIEGKNYSSVAFAELIKKLKDEKGEITFVIGGSHGIDESVKNSCAEKLSFSKMTFPHTLARVMLLEQIYRAFNILQDGKYHK